MSEDNQDYEIQKSTSPFADNAKPVRTRNERGQLQGRTSSLGAPRPAPEPEIQYAEIESTEPLLSDILADGSKRIPFGQKSARLRYALRPGFMRRWINDLPGRVAAAAQGGYAHVKDVEGRPVQRHAGSAPMGAALNTYLMEIPQQWYDEDFAYKQESVDETDKAIYGGTFKEEPDDKRYVPKDTPIKFGLTRGSGRG